jgi:hypothetical protein
MWNGRARQMPYLTTAPDNSLTFGHCLLDESSRKANLNVKKHSLSLFLQLPKGNQKNNG